VANVTLSIAPNLITRQRQNLGKTRSRGVELDFEFRPNGGWNLSGGYLLADSRVAEFPANTALVGRYVPQVARHQFTFQVGYAALSNFNFSLQGRVSSRQFDDDQNLLPFKGYFALDGFASKQITRNFAIFAAVENLFNQRYEVGRTPITTFGSPLTARIGLRIRFGSK
jgi:outer membrane receptor protein involved in Fe transport